jgi:hypothetical protein
MPRRFSAALAFAATRQADLILIQAGDERYEIPEVVISGG